MVFLDTNQDTASIVPANRLANIYAESKEFLTTKQHLDQKLQVAINEPVGETPEFATNFLWQVNFVLMCVIHTYIDVHLYEFM